jgi:hypothetical protein
MGVPSPIIRFPQMEPRSPGQSPRLPGLLLGGGRQADVIGQERRVPKITAESSPNETPAHLAEVVLCGLR